MIYYPLKKRRISLVHKKNKLLSTILNDINASKVYKKYSILLILINSFFFTLLKSKQFFFSINQRILRLFILTRRFDHTIVYRYSTSRPQWIFLSPSINVFFYIKCQKFLDIVQSKHMDNIEKITITVRCKLYQ